VHEKIDCHAKIVGPQAGEQSDHDPKPREEPCRGRRGYAAVRF